MTGVEITMLVMIFIYILTDSILDRKIQKNKELKQKLNKEVDTIVRELNNEYKLRK